MNEAKNGALKAGLITFGLTLLATIVGGIIVEKVIRNSDQRALAQNTGEKPPRQVVTTVLPEEEGTV